MSVSDVFPVDPSYVVPFEMDDDVIITPIEGNLERRKQISGLQLRTWPGINIKNMTVTEFESLTAFRRARGGRFDSFSFLPPINQDRIIKGLSVGTGDGSTVDFDLDNTDYFRRVYLGAGNRNVAYVDGGAVSATFSNTDGSKTSKVTYAAPPGGATVLTVDIDVYAICRFDSKLRTSLVAFAILSANYSFKELARDSI